MKKIFTASLLVLIAITTISMASAGFLWENKVETKGMPSGDTSMVTKTYFKPGYGLRVEQPEDTTVFNFKKKIVYTIDNKAKTYSETPFDQIANKGNMSDEEMKQVNDFMKKMMDNMKITKTKETKTINGYKCTKYIITIMGMDTTQWVTQDIKEYKELNAEMKKMMDSFEGQGQIKMIMDSFRSMSKVDGFPVMNESGFGTMKSTSVLLKFEKKNLDSSLFEPPSNYAKAEAH